MRIILLVFLVLITGFSRIFINLLEKLENWADSELAAREKHGGLAR